MLDPTAAIIATQETRRLCNSARPGAPVVTAERRSRRPAVRPMAGLLRALADRLDGGRRQLPSRADLA